MTRASPRGRPEHPVGFVGLGRMGEPMAARLVDAGLPVVVWNRSSPANKRMVALGATCAAAPDDLFRQCGSIFIMLANEAALDEVLRPDDPGFADKVRDRLIVNLGTVSPEWSRAFAARVDVAGGRFVEAPVSGSRGPAEDGSLIGLVAGRAEDTDEVRELLKPLCRETLDCGAVPGALNMKLAVNLYLITMVAGLAEAHHLAKTLGIDPGTFRDAIAAGPMASRVAVAKLDKLAKNDLSPEASIRDVHMNARLVVNAAEGAGVATPLARIARAMFARAEAAGLGAYDMIGVTNALVPNEDDAPELEEGAVSGADGLKGHRD